MFSLPVDWQQQAMDKIYFLCRHSERVGVCCRYSTGKTTPACRQPSHYEA